MGRLPGKLDFLAQIASAAIIAGCASTPNIPLSQGQVQDNLEALEVQLNKEAGDFRKKLDEHGGVYSDPVLLAYLDQLFRPMLAQPIGSSSLDFEVVVVRDPTLNAFTLGDGAVYLNSGLIAHLQTAEQLSFVIAHELAHIFNRDPLYFTHSYHKKTVAAKLADLMVSPALTFVGLGAAGAYGIGLAHRAAVTGYGRERETQADADALQSMRRLGYNPRSAIDVFTFFLNEKERYTRGIEIGFLSSHPSNQARMEAVEAILGSDDAPTEAADHEYLRQTDSLRIENAALNIQFARPYHAVEDLKAVNQRLPEHAKARFWLGEAYRAIVEHPDQLKLELHPKHWTKLTKPDTGEPVDWAQLAQEEYDHALQLDPAFPDTHRGLGLLLHAQDRHTEAVGHLQRYLELAPAPKDRRFVTDMIRRLQLAQQEAP